MDSQHIWLTSISAINILGIEKPRATYLNENIYTLLYVEFHWLCLTSHLSNIWLERRVLKNVYFLKIFISGNQMENKCAYGGRQVKKKTLWNCGKTLTGYSLRILVGKNLLDKHSF